MTSSNAATLNQRSSTGKPGESYQGDIPGTLAILHRALDQLNLAQDLPSLTQAIARETVNLLRVPQVQVFLHPSHRDNKTAPAGATQSIPFNGGLAGRIRREKKPILIEDLSTWPRPDPLLDEMQAPETLLAVPMIWQGEVTGIIAAGQPAKEKEITPADVELITLFASQAVIAVENARLLEAERYRRQEAENLRQATSALTSTLELNEVLDGILIELEKVVPYESASVLLIEDPNLRCMAARGVPIPEAVIGKVFPSFEQLSLEVKQTGRTLILEDVQRDGHFYGWGETSDPHSWMGIPLITHGEVFGYLTCDHRQAAIYSERDARIAEAFANQAAVAIENARLFEAERRQLLVAQTLQEVGALLTTQMGLEEVLENLLNLLGKVIEYDSVSIQLLNQEGRLTLAAGRGFPDIEEARQVSYEMSSQILNLHWAEHRVIVIPDTHAHPEWISNPFSDYVRSWVGAPLLVKGRFIGSLNVDSKTINTYDSVTGETVMAFANQAAIAIENARLFDAERKAREHAEAMREAAQMIGSSLSLKQVLEAVLEQLARVLAYDSASVLLVDGPYIYAQAWQGYEAFSASPNEKIRFEIAKGETAAFVVREGRPLVIEDTQHDPRWRKSPTSAHIKSWLGVPLKVRDEVIGLFSLDRVRVGGFEEEEIALAQAFAQQTAAAIANSLLFEAAGTRAAELEALHRASLSLTSSLELRQVLDKILESALSLLPDAHDSHIFLYDSEGDQHLTFGAAMWANRQSEQPWSEPRPDGLTATVARLGEAVVVPNMQEHALFKDTPNWAGAIVGLPLKIGQRVVGVMNIAYLQPRQFQDTELRVLRLLGDQAAIAIENARLFEQAAMERRHLELLFDIGRELATSLDVNEILQRAISLTCQKLKGTVAKVSLYDEAQRCLSLTAVHGRVNSSIAEVKQLAHFKAGVGLAGWIMENRRPACLTHVHRDSRWVSIPGIDEGLQSAIAAPILAREKLLGVMIVMHELPAAFTQQQMNLLEAICQEVGLALSNASRYQQVQRQLAESTLIQNLTQTINQRLELKDLLNEVAKQLGERLDYPRVSIYLIEEETLVLQASYGSGSFAASCPLDEGVPGQVASSGQSVLKTYPQQRAKRSRRKTHPTAQLPAAQLPAAQLSVPIFREKVVVGVINIESDLPDQLSYQDRDLLQILAGQVSVALENAVLFAHVRRHAEELEQTVDRRTAELTELYRLSQGIGYQLSYEELLHLLLHHIRSALGSEVVAGCLFNNHTQTAAIETARPVLPHAVDAIFSYCRALIADHCDLGREFNPDETHVLHAEGFQADASPIENLASTIRAPISINNQVIGMLLAMDEKPKAFGPAQVRLLNTFANQAMTAIQRLEAVLADQQKHLESLVEHVPVGILLFDSDSHLLMANPLGRELLSVLSAADSGSRVVALGPYTLEDLIAHYQDPLPVEITLDGPPQRFFAVQTRQITNSKTQWVLTIREITQERENQLRVQSQERLATVGQLAAGIAHDFNNIMAAILVYADLLSQDPDIKAGNREKLAIIRQQVQRSASLIRQILDFSRRAIMEQSPLDLLPFVKELDKLLVRILPETIQLELTYQPGSYWVKADPTRLQQVIMNLVVNARDAMPDGGLLTFRLGSCLLQEGENPPVPDMPAGRWICISISDTGVGIPLEIQKYIFDPFFTTKPVGMGTGLGLAQVYGIIKQHDGYITLDSQPGQGACFSFYLPALVPPKETIRPAVQPVQMQGNGETVMVVEDNETTRLALKAMLEAYNYQVVAAANGEEALQFFNQSEDDISLLISDVVMPKIGGFALYQTLKERRPGTKILFVTGHPIKREDQELLETGTVQWLQKPFTMQEFSSAVSKLIGGRDAENPLVKD